MLNNEYNGEMQNASQEKGNGPAENKIKTMKYLSFIVDNKLFITLYIKTQAHNESVF